MQSVTGPRFNVKMTSYQYRKSHCGDKTILRPSYLHNGISYTDKMSSLYWIRDQLIPCTCFRSLCHPFSHCLRESLVQLNTLRPRQDGRHFPDEIFSNAFFEWKCMNFDQDFTEVCSKGPINIITALVQIMAWRRPGYKPLSEPMMVSLLTLICVTQPQ